MRYFKDIPYESMEFVWISNHWDIHLRGICRYRNRWHFFETNIPDDGDWTYLTCSLYKLSLSEKLGWWLAKQWFELMVGTYWTYTSGKRPKVPKSRPAWRAKLYYKLKGFEL